MPHYVIIVITANALRPTVPTYECTRRRVHSQVGPPVGLQVETLDELLQHVDFESLNTKIDSLGKLPVLCNYLCQDIVDLQKKVEQQAPPPPPQPSKFANFLFLTRSLRSIKIILSITRKASEWHRIDATR